MNRAYNADAAQLKCYFSYASGSSSLNNTTTIIIPTYISGNLIADSTVVAGNATVGVNSLVSVKYKNASSVDITDAKIVIEGNIQEDSKEIELPTAAAGKLSGERHSDSEDSVSVYRCTGECIRNRLWRV